MEKSLCAVPKTFEEEYKMVEAFFDKYESLIRSAPRNSILGMINDLDDAFLNIEGVIGDRDEGLLPSNDRALNRSKRYITHVALILAQMWADENQDIELVCTDPATGEEVVVEGTPSEEDLGDTCLNCQHWLERTPLGRNCGKDLRGDDCGWCEARSRTTSRIAGCKEYFKNKNEEEKEND